MQTKSKEKINIVTLGCAKNIVDSEVLLTQLKGNDKKAFHQRDDINPDVVIVNTCTERTRSGKSHFLMQILLL